MGVIKGAFEFSGKLSTEEEREEENPELGE